MSGPYHRRLFHSCGWSAEVPFGDAFHLTGLFTACPRDGAAIPTHNSGVYGRRGEEESWRLVTVARVSTATWWNPLTWGTGYWIDSKGQRLEGAL